MCGTGPGRAWGPYISPSATPPDDARLPAPGVRRTPPALPSLQPAARGPAGVQTGKDARSLSFNPPTGKRHGTFQYFERRAARFIFSSLFFPYSAMKSENSWFVVHNFTLFHNVCNSLQIF